METLIRQRVATNRKRCIGLRIGKNEITPDVVRTLLVRVAVEVGVQQRHGWCVALAHPTHSPKSKSKSNLDSHLQSHSGLCTHKLGRVNVLSYTHS